MIHGIIAGQFTEAISVDIVEAATAVDATATGNVIFATLVDDPANVRDVVDAFLGEIMLEAASAVATVTVGLAYTAAILEEATAAAAASTRLPTTLTADVAEAAAAADAPDAILVVMSRSAMLPKKVFVNSSGSRDANAAGVMVNM
jgi:hypothetical protein